MAKQVKFELIDTDPNITEDSTFGTGWRDTWKFRCPQHMEIVIRNGDLFSLKAYDSGDSEYAAPDAIVKIEVRDPSEERTLLIYGPANYTASDEFQDVKSTAEIRLKQEVRVRPREYIVFMTKDDTGMDAASVANSYCRLLTTKIIE